jgi:hypothetical protein
LAAAARAAAEVVAITAEVVAVAADGQQKFIQRHHYQAHNHTQQGQEQTLLALRL